MCRCDPSATVEPWMRRGPFWSITRTPEELSIVCPIDEVPAGVRHEGPFAAFVVAGPLDFSLTGIVSRISAPLGRRGHTRLRDRDIRHRLRARAGGAGVRRTAGVARRWVGDGRVDAWDEARLAKVVRESTVLPRSDLVRLSCLFHGTFAPAPPMRRNMRETRSFAVMASGTARALVSVGNLAVHHGRCTHEHSFEFRASAAGSRHGSVPEPFAGVGEPGLPRHDNEQGSGLGNVNTLLSLKPAGQRDDGVWTGRDRRRHIRL